MSVQTFQSKLQNVNLKVDFKERTKGSPKSEGFIIWRMKNVPTHLVAALKEKSGKLPK